jgi:hypothetical protein
MMQPQIKRPFELLGELFVKENTRTLVIHGKDRTLLRLPLGYAILAGVGLFFVMPPGLAIVLLMARYMNGGSILIAGPSSIAAPAVVVPTRIGRHWHS